MHVSSKVPVAFHGKGLLYYLTTRYSYLPAAVWQQLLQDGKISCQGASSVMKQWSLLKMI